MSWNPPAFLHQQICYHCLRCSAQISHTCLPRSPPSQQNCWWSLNQSFHIFYLVNNFHQQFFASLVELQKLQEGCLTPDLLQNSSTQLCLVGAAVGWRGRPVVQLQNLFLLLTMPEPEMSQLFLNIPSHHVCVHLNSAKRPKRPGHSHTKEKVRYPTEGLKQECLK